MEVEGPRTEKIDYFKSIDTNKYASWKTCTEITKKKNNASTFMTVLNLIRNYEKRSYGISPQTKRSNKAVKRKS